MPIIEHSLVFTPFGAATLCYDECSSLPDPTVIEEEDTNDWTARPPVGSGSQYSGNEWLSWLETGVTWAKTAKQTINLVNEWHMAFGTGSTALALVSAAQRR